MFIKTIINQKRINNIKKYIFGTTEYSQKKNIVELY